MTVSDTHRPHRDDDVATWLERRRDALDPRNATDNIAWMTIDRLLERYCECADYGLTLRPEDDTEGDP